MKRILFFICLTQQLLCCLAQSQDFLPIIEEGKVWYLMSFETLPYYSIYLSGDTIIDDKVCKKTFLYSPSDSIRYPENYLVMADSGTIAFNPVYEEDGNFFLVDNDAFYLMFDFNVNKGESMTIDLFFSNDEENNSTYVYDVKTYTIRGVDRRVWHTQIGDFIEGIGFEGGLFNMWQYQLFGTYPAAISQCVLNEKVIFDGTEFWNMLRNVPIADHPDVNFDEAVDIVDANMVVNSILGKSNLKPLESATATPPIIGFPCPDTDVNSDGEINITDLNIVVNAMLRP